MSGVATNQKHTIAEIGGSIGKYFCVPELCKSQREGEEEEGRREREYEYEYDNEPKRGFWIMATDVATERDIGHMVRTWQKNNLKMP